MANTIENTLRKVGNTIENILGSNKTQQPSTNNGRPTNQSCLERIGIEARKEHLYRNEWKKDLQYTKALVDAEYSVQTEFKVGTTDADVATQVADAEKKQAEREAKTIEKNKKKAEKKAAKEKKEEEQKSGRDDVGYSEPVEAPQKAQTDSYSTQNTIKRLERNYEIENTLLLTHLNQA